MKKISIFAICLLFSVISSAQTNKLQSKIAYALSMEKPQSHYFDVVMKLKSIDAKMKQQGFVDVKMAVWTPGSYLVREYADLACSFIRLGIVNGARSRSIAKKNQSIFKNQQQLTSICVVDNLLKLCCIC